MATTKIPLSGLIRTTSKTSSTFVRPDGDSQIEMESESEESKTLELMRKKFSNKKKQTSRRGVESSGNLPFTPNLFRSSMRMSDQRRVMSDTQVRNAYGETSVNSSQSPPSPGYNYSVSHSWIKTPGSTSSNKLRLEEQLVQLRSAQKGVYLPALEDTNLQYLPPSLESLKKKLVQTHGRPEGKESSPKRNDSHIATRKQSQTPESGRVTTIASKHEEGTATSLSMQSFLRKPNFSNGTSASQSVQKLNFEEPNLSEESPQRTRSYLEKPKQKASLRQQRQRPVPIPPAFVSSNPTNPKALVGEEKRQSPKNIIRNVIGTSSTLIDTVTNPDQERTTVQNYVELDMISSLSEDIKLTNDIAAVRGRLSSPNSLASVSPKLESGSSDQYDKFTALRPPQGKRMLPTVSNKNEDIHDERIEDKNKMTIAGKIVADPTFVNVSDLDSVKNQAVGSIATDNKRIVGGVGNVLQSFTSTPRENIKKILHSGRNISSAEKLIVHSADMVSPGAEDDANMKSEAKSKKLINRNTDMVSPGTEYGQNLKSEGKNQMVLNLQPVLANSEQQEFSYISSLLAFVRMAWFLFSIGLTACFLLICADSRIEIRVSRGSFSLPN